METAEIQTLRSLDNLSLISKTSVRISFPFGVVTIFLFLIPSHACAIRAKISILTLKNQFLRQILRFCPRTAHAVQGCFVHFLLVLKLKTWLEESPFVFCRPRCPWLSASCPWWPKFVSRSPWATRSVHALVCRPNQIRTSKPKPQISTRTFAQNHLPKNRKISRKLL